MKLAHQMNMEVNLMSHPTAHPIYTHVVMYPVHDELMVSSWRVTGRRASFVFEDNGRRAVQGRKSHSDIEVEIFNLPSNVYQLRALLWQTLEHITKHSVN
jgi:hypothetical protein